MTADDYEEIRQLLARYNFAVDGGDADGWAACFIPDGVFQVSDASGALAEGPLGGRHEGTDALKAYAATHQAIRKGRARHWNWNLEIDGDGDEATMRCYMMILLVGRPERGATGIYNDRLRKVDGAWRFVERHVTVDPPS